MHTYVERQLDLLAATRPGHHGNRGYGSMVLNAKRRNAQLETRGVLYVYQVKEVALKQSMNARCRPSEMAVKE